MAGKHKNGLSLLVGLLVIVGAAAGTLYFKKVADATQVAVRAPRKKPLSVVEVYELSMVHRPVRFAARGVLAGIQETLVSAEIDGRVMAKPVVEGQLVKPGDVLCQIDPTMHRLALQAAEARLKEAQATYEKTEADLKRVLDLESQHKTQLEQHAYVTARDAALAARNLFSTQLEQARERLSKCTIRSPIHGEIAAISYEVGELLSPMAPVVEIVNLNPMKLVVDLPDFEASQIGPRPKITVTCAAFPGRTFSGQLQAVYPKANPLTRRVPVEIVVGNDDGKLRSGIFVDCGIESAQTTPRLLVPAYAVLHELGADYCLVAADGEPQATARRRNIRTAPVPGSVSLLEVVEGLHEGDRVILNKHQEISLGEPVDPRPVILPELG